MLNELTDHVLKLERDAEEARENEKKGLVNTLNAEDQAKKDFKDKT
jgi:hypothetical protein